MKVTSITNGAVALLAAGLLAACGGSPDSGASSAGPSGSGDVKVDKCEWLPFDAAVAAHVADRPRATLTVTNHGVQARDYMITVAFDSPDGKTQYDTAVTSVDSLDKGQSGTAVAISLGDKPGPLGSSGHGPGKDSGPPVPITCKVVKVEPRHF